MKVRCLDRSLKVSYPFYSLRQSLAEVHKGGVYFKGALRYSNNERSGYRASNGQLIEQYLESGSMKAR